MAIIDKRITNNSNLSAGVNYSGSTTINTSDSLALNLEYEGSEFYPLLRRWDALWIDHLSKFISVGVGGLYETTDLINWSKIEINVLPANPTYDLDFISLSINSNSTFLAIGYSPTFQRILISNGSTIFFSNNGVDWEITKYSRPENATDNGGNSFYSQTTYNIIWHNGFFYSMGYSGESRRILRSADGGITWFIESPINSTRFTHSAISGNVLIVGTNFGNIIYRNVNNGVWEIIEMEPGNTNGFVNSVVFANSLFVALNNRGQVFTSSNNGLNWTRRSNPLENSEAKSLIFNSLNSKFYIIYKDFKTTVSSIDGVNWVIEGKDYSYLDTKNKYFMFNSILNIDKLRFYSNLNTFAYFPTTVNNPPIYYTSNNLIDWNLIRLKENINFNRVAFNPFNPNTSSLWRISNNNEIYKGNTLVNLPIVPDSVNYIDIAFKSSNSVCVVGNDSLGNTVAIASTTTDVDFTLSPDNLGNFSVSSSGAKPMLIFASHLNNYFFVNNNSSTIYSSSEGLSWSSNITPETFRGLTYLKEVNLILGFAFNNLYYSSDGINWNLCQVKGVSGVSFFIVSYNSKNKTYYATSSQFNINGYATSKDGINWVGYEGKQTPGSNFSYNNSIFAIEYIDALDAFIGISSNTIWLSKDFLIWAVVKKLPTEGSHRFIYNYINNTIEGVINSSTENNNIFKTNILASNKITSSISPHYSSFYLNFIQEFSSPENKSWRVLTWSPKLKIFCALSNQGSSNRVATSEDGNNWTLVDPGSGLNNQTWFSIIWVDDLSLFVAVGSVIMTSSDGISWTLSYTPPSPRQFTSIAWSNKFKYLIAVINNMNQTVLSTDVMRSFDGLNWENIPFLSFSTGSWSGITATSDHDIRSIERFILVSQNNSNMASSSSGETWSNYSDDTGFQNNWQSVCFSPEKNIYVAVATQGTATGKTIAYSSSGRNWILANRVDGSLLKVIWVKELSIFVAVGRDTTNNNNSIFVSPDGINWDKKSVPDTILSNPLYTDVSYAPELGIFCIIGDDHFLVTKSIFK
jgi:hypothetical protein